MSIAEFGERSKQDISRIPRTILILLILLLSATASFGLGILVGRDLGEGRGKSEFSIENLPMLPIDNPSDAPANAYLAGGQVVASRLGTKYFLPWCGGADLISEANKVWFENARAAETHGYSPAANCKGL